MKYGSKYDIIYTIMNMREVIVMMIRPPSALPRTIQFHRKMSSFVHSTELLIFIDMAIIDCGYIDTHNTDITF